MSEPKSAIKRQTVWEQQGWQATEGGNPTGTLGRGLFLISKEATGTHLRDKKKEKERQRFWFYNDLKNKGMGPVIPAKYKETNKFTCTGNTIFYLLKQNLKLSLLTSTTQWIMQWHKKYNLWRYANQIYMHQTT